VPADSGHPASTDVAAAQKDILAAEALTVIYPLWWMSMPAILKGYIDRVFARGFAYESGPDGVRGLIAGKQCVLVTVSGAPLWRLADAGRWDAAQVLQDTHIFRSVGYHLLEHLHFDGVVPHLSAAIIAGHIDRVRACARQHFSTDAISA
jgi:NAD(P)H dehydrogenase (quinone)